MGNVTRTRLIRIGNSRGIRIPKAFIEQLDLESAVELVVQKDHLEIRSGKKPRVGWGEQFQAMAERGDDKLIDEVTATAWDEGEWEW
ncbi:MAG: MazE family transcriptional regulator [Armatimonadetes bacterium RBG_16_58_9]|nr:MAG: MazE family transcriptional regulator [Armatimonadetes bacterium RBG_16_58_9]